MRVISGRWGGRILPARVPAGTRPTQDAVREAIFNILANWLNFDNIAVLDLFAGSGAMGIEALSRGASQCTFVERSAAAAAAIAENCRSLGIESSRYRIVRGDAMRFLERADQHQYRLVIADPPYTAGGAVMAIVATLDRREVVETNGIVVIEHPSGYRIASTDRLHLVAERRWGQTACTILERQ
ncbi:MAG: 16S rRNA (guanine(966)-N(2))-methyltransferase RsmD [Chlorobi bacterium]|nr:16S rRNA (guanine(966)-N(2))-methyltransferase RsmD [Chlorobiota bacterium]